MKIKQRCLALAVTGGLAVSALSLGAGAALAQDRYAPSGPQEGPYAQFFLGFDAGGEYEFSSGGGSFDVDRSTNVVAGGTLGYRFPFGPGGSVRPEAEFSYAPTGLEDTSFGDGKTYGFLANGWYDFHLGNGFTPYAGGGLGIGVIDFEDGDSGTGLGYQIGGGVLVDVPGTEAFVGVNYRYTGVTETEIDGVDVSTNAHRFTASVGLPF